MSFPLRSASILPAALSGLDSIRPGNDEVSMLKPK